VEVLSCENRTVGKPRSNESKPTTKLTLRRVEDRPVPITNNGLKDKYETYAMDLLILKGEENMNYAI